MSAHPVLPFASVADHLNAFIMLYDPYRVEEARRQIAQYDATRMVDAPRAQVIVIIPTFKQHIESGSRVDLDVLRSGVDAICVYDNESARRIGKALSGTGVRVVVLPSPKVREITHHHQMTEQQKLPGKAAMLQALFDITSTEARELAMELNKKKSTH